MLQLLTSMNLWRYLSTFARTFIKKIKSKRFKNVAFRLKALKILVLHFIKFQFLQKLSISVHFVYSSSTAWIVGIIHQNIPPKIWSPSKTLGDSAGKRRDKK